MTKMQELLGRILKNRIEREKADGTLDADKANLSQTLDMFVAANKIATEQYAEFTELIIPVATTTPESKAVEDNTTKPEENKDTNKTA